jgi:hypothetical protein
LTPYVRQGSIHAVPVLRHRLNFAVQVQRAVRELGLDQSDAVAVALPESVRAQVLAAIREFPEVSLVVSADRDAGQREVFPVTPADGIVEAIRIAQESGLGLWFVDQEVAPGHLIDRFCIAEEPWPDDGLALELGAEAYLGVVGDRVRHPPARFEPVDSWRELHKATRLQEITGRYRRVLFVCEATHLQPVLRLIRRPVPPVRVDLAGTSAPRYRIALPSPSILLHYLDHIPRLVQAYEQSRAAGEAHSFDKRQALLEILHELSRESSDLQLSIRHYDAFALVLARLMEQEKLVSPRFDVVLQASDGCFPAVFRERVFRRLLRYFDFVKVQRIGRVHRSKEAVFEVRTTPPRGGGRDVYVARNCMQNDFVYETHRVPGEPAAAEEVSAAPDVPTVTIELDPPSAPPPSTRFGKREQWEAWPLMSLFINRMRSKAYTVARQRPATVVRSSPFNGSLEDGIDFRRTIRSHYRGQPELYVKRQRIGPAPTFDSYEPIVWLHDGYETVELSDPKRNLSYLYAGSERRTLISDWYMGDVPEPEDPAEGRRGHPVEIHSFALHGRVQFMDLRLTVADVERRLGAETDDRVPDEYTVSSADVFSTEMTHHYELDLRPARWWELLIVAAMHYAKESVVLVAPQRFVMPDQIARMFTLLNKRIIRIPLTRFTAEERRKLGRMYLIGHQFHPKGDVNDLAHLDFVVDEFGDAMKTHWT